MVNATFQFERWRLYNADEAKRRSECRSYAAEACIYFGGAAVPQWLCVSIDWASMVSNETIRTISMAVGIILLAGIAAWIGLAHGCEAPVGGGMIAGNVTLAPALADRAGKEGVLFVIVRRPQGSRQPVAVKRITNPRFPVKFTINDQDLMIQGAQLKGMVEVIARLDRDGSAGPPQPGDLEGEYERNPTLVGGDNIDIQINKAY